MAQAQAEGERPFEEQAPVHQPHDQQHRVQQHHVQQNDLQQHHVPQSQVPQIHVQQSHVQQPHEQQPPVQQSPFERYLANHGQRVHLLKHPYDQPPPLQQSPGWHTPGKPAAFQQRLLQHPAAQPPPVPQFRPQQSAVQPPPMQPPPLQQPPLQQPPLQQPPIQQSAMQPPPMQPHPLQQPPLQQPPIQQSAVQPPPMQPPPLQQPPIQQPPIQQSPIQQFPMQRAPTQRDPANSSTSASATILWNDLGLLSHLCNLVNAALSGLNVYLSLEPLSRKANEGTLQPRTVMTSVYHLGMQSQAGIVHDLCVNISTVLNAMVKTALHLKLERLPSYNSLLTGALKLKDVVVDLPQATIRNGAVVPPPPPTPAGVARMHVGCTRLYTLCHGDRSTGVEGWHACMRIAHEVLRMAEA